MQIDKEVIVPPVEEKVEFVLRLSHDEACALQSVLGKIGGTTSKLNPRDVTDQIYQELSSLGIDYWSGLTQKYSESIARQMEIS